MSLSDSKCLKFGRLLRYGSGWHATFLDPNNLKYFETCCMFTLGTNAACQRGERQSIDWHCLIGGRYFAEDYGYVSGVKEMKKEIWKRGPIGCGVDATAKFDAWVEHFEHFQEIQMEVWLQGVTVKAKTFWVLSKETWKWFYVKWPFARGCMASILPTIENAEFVCWQKVRWVYMLIKGTPAASLSRGSGILASTTRSQWSAGGRTRLYTIRITLMWNQIKHKCCQLTNVRIGDGLLVSTWCSGDGTRVLGRSQLVGFLLGGVRILQVRDQDWRSQHLHQHHHYHIINLYCHRLRHLHCHHHHHPGWRCTSTTWPLSRTVFGRLPESRFDLRNNCRNSFIFQQIDKECKLIFYRCFISDGSRKDTLYWSAAYF